MRRSFTAIFFAFVALVGVTATAAGAATAVVVVESPEGRQTRVIEFEGSISGMEALQRAGAAPETIPYGPLGLAVCKLFRYGDEAVPGRCPGGWTYYRSVGGAGSWSYSGLGASNTTVRDGDVEGWKYGGGAPGASASFCAYVSCAPPPPPPPPPTDPPAPPPPAETPAAAAPAPSGSSGDGAPSATAGTTASGKGKAATDGSGANGGSDGAEAADDGGKDDTKPDGTKGSTTTSGADTKAARATKHQDDRESALGAPSGGDDGGSGSPVGVLIVVAILVAGASALLLIKRSKSVGSGSPS